MNPKGGAGVETGRSGAEVPVRWEMLGEGGQEPRCWTIQSQAERRDRGQTEKSWLLFEEIDTFLYDLTRNSKIEKLVVFSTRAYVVLTKVTTLCCVFFGSNSRVRVA